MKKIQKPIKLTIINLLLFSSLAAVEPQFNLEQEKIKLSNKVFKHYDLNKDKTLSLNEFNRFNIEMQQKEQKKHVEHTIKSCDKNGNGKIELSEIPTEKEMQEAYKNDYQNINKMCYIDKMEFNSINKSGDDFITKEEIFLFFKQSSLGIWGNNYDEMPKIDKLKEFKNRLNRCDTNKDREISLMEATNTMCYMSSEEFLKYSRDPKKSFSIDEITKAPNEIGIELEHKFKRCDSNSDKKLNLIEATSMFCNMPSDEFIKIDTDKNDYISKSELQKMYEEELSETNKVSSKVIKEMPPMVQISFAINQCDENRDRKLSKDEADTCELPIKTFEKFDHDKSNSIEENDITFMQNLEEFNLIDVNNNKKLEQKEFEESMGNKYSEF